MAAFDLGLNRSPGPNGQVRRRHFKQKQGGKDGVGSWHVLESQSWDTRKQGGMEGGVGVREEPGVPGRGPQELGSVCSKR